MGDQTDKDMQAALEKVLAAAISDDAMKAINKQVEEIRVNIEDDLMYRIKDELAPNLTAWVAELAGKAVEAILEGNEEMMREYLSCRSYGWNGRSGDHNLWNRDIAEQHPIIHGKLFEQGCVLLRKKIVDAHKDLLVNERILDLEDQVKSLVAQVNKRTPRRT